MTPPILNILDGFCYCGCGQKTAIATKHTGVFRKGEHYRFRRGHGSRARVTPEDAQPFKIHNVYCRLIPLTRNQWAIVNAIDYLPLMQWKWNAVRMRNGWYACRSVHIGNNKYITIFMHQVLGGKDHKNRITLDNRQDNLRPATHRQNMQNRGLQSNNTSGYKGVSKDQRRGTWKTEIDSIYIKGGFTSPEAAARRYDEEAIIRHGEFAWLNFPDEHK